MICYNWEEKKQIPPVPHPSLFSSFSASPFLAVIERREAALFPCAHFCPSEKWATSQQLFMPWSYALCGWLGVENQLLASHCCVCFVSDASEYALLFLNFHQSFCSDGALKWLPHSSTSLTIQCGVELDCGPWGTVISCVKSLLLTGMDVACILWKSSLMLAYLFSRTFRGPFLPQEHPCQVDCLLILFIRGLQVTAYLLTWWHWMWTSPSFCVSIRSGPTWWCWRWTSPTYFSSVGSRSRPVWCWKLSSLSSFFLSSLLVRANDCSAGNLSLSLSLTHTHTHPHTPTPVYVWAHVSLLFVHCRRVTFAAPTAKAVTPLSEEVLTQGRRTLSVDWGTLRTCFTCWTHSCATVSSVLSRLVLSSRTFCVYRCSVCYSFFLGFVCERVCFSFVIGRMVLFFVFSLGGGGEIILNSS